MRPVNVIDLPEFTHVEIDRKRLPIEAAEVLRQKYSDKVSVSTKSFGPDSNWELKSQGWVGYIPLTPEVSIRLLPKPGVTITNLFRMLDYAYNLESFCLSEKGLFDCSSLEDFYERLANILANRILDRSRRGLYHAYQPRSDRLSYICGRIDLQRASLRPWEARLECYFEEHTSNIEDNQILAWTLLQILRSGLCSERSLPLASHAYRKLLSFAEPIPCGPEACIGRLYHRLNHDYQPMHALCRLFLEHLGPAYKVGNREMIPFLVKMDRLYERFVAEWLRSHPLIGYSVEAQKEVIIDRRQNMKFRMDLALYDEKSHRPVCIMDTKYKVGVPSMNDIYQVIAYCEANGCQDAMLIYPSKNKQISSIEWGDIRVKSATFSLEGNLEAAGQAFTQELSELLNER